MLTFESGLVGVIEQSWFVPDRRLFWGDIHLEVVGMQGTAHITEPNDGSWMRTPEATVYPDSYLMPQLHGKMVGALEDELAYFAECVTHNRRPTHGTLAEAREALRVGLTIVESATSGKAISLTE
jgi:predicted dehydrogenase